MTREQLEDVLNMKQPIKETADTIMHYFNLKDARINELLHVNNEYLERARSAERLNDELKLSIAGCARLFGQLAALIKNP